MHVISNAKKMIFCDCGSVPFFCKKNPGRSVRKNVKSTGHVCFVYQALFFLTETAINHVLNNVNQTKHLSAGISQLSNATTFRSM